MQMLHCSLNAHLWSEEKKVGSIAMSRKAADFTQEQHTLQNISACTNQILIFMGGKEDQKHKYKWCNL